MCIIFLTLFFTIQRKYSTMKNYFHQDNIIHVRYSLIVWFGSITLLKKDVILNAVFSFKKSSRRQNCLLQYNAELSRNTIWWILYEMIHITFKLKISNFPASILLSIPNDTYKSAILLRHVRIGFQDVYWIPSKLHLLSFVSLDTAWKNVRSSDIRLTKLYMRPYLNI